MFAVIYCNRKRSQHGNPEKPDYNPEDIKNDAVIHVVFSFGLDLLKLAVTEQGTA